MKDSAASHEANPQKAEPSAFERFAKAMRALVAVPKREIADQISQKKAPRKAKSGKSDQRLNP
jgi:hypothetical protein